MSTISSFLVRRMVEASERDDTAELLHRLGLQDIPGPFEAVDANAFWDVIETIVASGDEGLAFRYAELLDPDDAGTLGHAFKTATDLRAALERHARYTLLLSDTATYELRPDGRNGIALVLCGRPAHRTGVRVSNEAALAAMLSMCRKVARPGSVVRPTSVSFRHRPPDDLGLRRDFFECSLSYGSEVDALHLGAAFLDTPTRLADAAISEYFVDRLDDALRNAERRRTIEDRVRDVVANGLADGVPPMRLVARRLAMSERTLHRRLGDEGLRYQDVVVDVRTALATEMLAMSDQSLVDIAFLTGFSDQSAFQRAFKRWTGTTPLAFRRD